MNTLIMLATLTATIFVLNSIFNYYLGIKESKQKDRQQHIEVLRIFTKNELTKKENYQEFIDDFMKLKGWSGYVDYSLWNKSIGEDEVKKVVGDMVNKNQSCGLVITLENVNSDAKKYIEQVKERGYDIRCVDGEGIIDNLYDLRTTKLKGILVSTVQ